MKFKLVIFIIAVGVLGLCGYMNWPTLNNNIGKRIVNIAHWF